MVERPYWLTKPCPEWCESRPGGRALPHRSDEDQEDRDHFKSLPNIDLTLYDAEGKNGYSSAPGTMFVSASQHYRAAEPVISITVPTTTEADRQWLVTGEQDFHMTVDEVRSLRDQLSGLLDMLDGGAA